MNETITIEGELSLTQIIDLIKTHGSRGLPYHFPDAMLPTPEVVRLHKWLEAHTNYLLFWSHPSVTIKAHNPDLAAFAFNPEEDIP
jgi:hypothetical protein